MALANADFTEIYNEFPTNSIGPDDIILVKKSSTGQTHGILGSDFVQGTDLSAFQWVSTASYSIGDPVLYDGQWWISQINGNIGNIPTEDANWNLENKVTAIIIKPWTSGIYENIYSLTTDSGIIYRLKASVTVPFNSPTTPSSDLTNWELIGSAPISSNDTELIMNVGGTVGGQPNLTYDPALNNLELGTGITHTGAQIAHNFIEGLDHAIMAGTASIRWSTVRGEGHTINNLGASTAIRINNALIDGGFNSEIRNNGVGSIFSPVILGTRHLIENSGTINSPYAIGNACKSSASFGMAFGFNSQTTGIGSFAKGFDDSFTGTGIVVSEPVLASGRGAINISSNSSAQTAGHGALADHSGVYSSFNANIPSDSLRSVAIGGNAIKADAATPDTVFLPKVRIGRGTGGSIVAGAGTEDLLVIDGTTGEVKTGGTTWKTSGITSLASGIEVNADATDFLSFDYEIDANNNLNFLQSVASESLLLTRTSTSVDSDYIHGLKISGSSSYLFASTFDQDEDQAGIMVSSTEFKLRDDINSLGVIYAGDYYTAGSANLRWIPDWGAVKRSEMLSYTVGTVPANTSNPRLIYVTDEVGGAVPAFDDGTNWRRMTDRAIIST